MGEDELVIIKEIVTQKLGRFTDYDFNHRNFVGHFHGTIQKDHANNSVYLWIDEATLYVQIVRYGPDARRTENATYDLCDPNSIDKAKQKLEELLNDNIT